MSTTALCRYIAAGCLVFDKTEAGVPDSIWLLLEREQWHHLGPFSTWDSPDEVESKDSGQLPEAGGSPPPPCRFLEQELRDHLLKSSGCLSFCASLLQNGWIRLSIALGFGDPEKLVVRVYLLPDDVDNRVIPRSDVSLQKARSILLSRLDFSRSTWHGQTDGKPSMSPRPFDTPEPIADSHDGESRSLLHMFNSIPSPDPAPNDIQDCDARDAAHRLMDSSVLGLKTTLYTYQRRSAALMLQRESQRRRTLDPRLTKVADHSGHPWYYDAVAGTCLREPRLYDAPCGGILAEEMGAGKTLICLALILATRHIPASAPDHLRSNQVVVRRRVGSLADMAAACITRNSVPWRTVFGGLGSDEIEYPLCVDAIRRNPAFYTLPPPPRRRQTRQPDALPGPARIQLSHCSLVIVPPNLVQQWKQEIAKHTSGLVVLTLDKKRELPPVEQLMEYDVILFSSTRFEGLADDLVYDHNSVRVLRCPLAQIHFKRCIVDEGHRLGNSTVGRRSNMHLIIDCLRVTAKWIVTGTPSKGLFGVEGTPDSTTDEHRPSGRRQAASSADLERDDLRRIGSIATLYLHMRPWANLWSEAGDSPANWAVYVMQPRHSARSFGRLSCLKSTLDSLIIRHRLSEVGDLLPSVDEKVVYLDGSFQDRLALNLFSMMIIFNAVQSQRTDQDYFFHPRQRKALLELVSNLRQASFFGGSFFSPAEIRKAVETAEEFLREGKVQISAEDEALLREGIALGRLAEGNTIKRCANLFREVPLYVENFPWQAGGAWSLDGEEGDPVCTDCRLVLALQKLLHPLVDAPTSLQLMFESGRFHAYGREERVKGIEDQDRETESTAAGRRKTLAGNTRLGQDSSSPRKRRSSQLSKGPQEASLLAGAADHHEVSIAAPLADTKLVSTASAKLSYLIDQIVLYQASEQIIVFYENDNVAYYLAGVLEILQIEHLIYAKGLTPERRAQYVATFNHNPKFRVLLMDITQAAFGLDMQSASRIYFVHPVLNPQVEAQAIGRARRISQRKPVSVETLVLRGSVEEVIVRRRGEMTQAEQWKCRSILDDRPIYEWILNAAILPLRGVDEGGGGGGGGGGEGCVERDVPGPEQMAALRVPQFIFGRGFGRALSHPDQDLVAVAGSPEGKKAGGVVAPETARMGQSPTPGASVVGHGAAPPPPRKKARVRFADPGEGEA